MKSKKIFSVAISMAIAATAVAGLAACGSGGDSSDHIHAFTAWVYDDTNHWMACPAEDPPTKNEKSKGTHVFDPTTGLCECGYKDPNFSGGNGNNNGGNGNNNGGNNNGGNNGNNGDENQGGGNNQGGGDIGGGGISSEDAGFPAYIMGEFNSWQPEALMMEEWEYDGHHFYIKDVQLTAGQGFCFYDSFSNADSENPDTYYKYDAIWGSEGQNVSDYFTKVTDADGNENIAAKADGAYSFDLYIGTTYDNEPQAPHINFTTDVTPGLGGGDVGGGNGDTPVTPTGDIYIMGTFNGWEKVAMTKDTAWGYAGAHYTYDVELSANDEILFTDGGENYYRYGAVWGENKDTWAKAVTDKDGNENIGILLGGNYHFDFYIGTYYGDGEDRHEEAPHVNATIEGRTPALGAVVSGDKNARLAFYGKGEAGAPAALYAMLPVCGKAYLGA